MRILLLLGSGVSLPTFGAQCTCEGITGRLLHDNWFRITDACYCLRNDIALREEPTGALPIQLLLRRLKSIAEDYYRFRGNWLVTYEDLFYMVYQIRNEETGDEDNPAILPFRDQMHTIALDLFSDHPVASFSNLKDLTYEAVNFIKCAVCHYLSEDEIPIGLDGLIDLINSSKFGVVDTFTLNHDTLLERAFERRNLPLITGFEDEINNVRWYNPILFNSRGFARLFKLHGSINWRTLQNNDWGNIGIPHWTEGREPLSPHGKRLDIDSPPIILAGTYNKERQYYYDIIADMHWYFYNRLRNPETQLVVVTGYGWNDRSINGRLREWLLRRGENKILLIHKFPQQITRSKSFMKDDYQRLIENKQLVLIPKWPSELESGELNEKVKELMA